MGETTPSASRIEGFGEVEFFGVKLKVHKPRLAALLTSDVTDEVTVVAGRVREVLAADGSGVVADEAVVAADALGETVGVRLEQALAEAAPTDVQLRRDDAQLPPADEMSLGALVERPA